MFFAINVTICLNLSLFRCMSCMWSSYAKGLTTLRITYVKIGVPSFFPLLLYTVEPRFYDRRSNDIPDLMINILCPGKSYNKLYGAESRFYLNDFKVLLYKENCFNPIFLGTLYSFSLMCHFGVTYFFLALNSNSVC